MAGAAAALIVLLAAAGALLLTRWLGDLLRPGTATAPEQVPFLGGTAPAVHAWSRFHLRYYAMALLFLAFDMEMVFMYPWAVLFNDLSKPPMPFFGFGEMLVFVAILVAALAYVWRKKAIGWE